MPIFNYSPEFNGWNKVQEGGADLDTDKVHIGIFYPADPVGVSSGWIDNCIRELLKRSPPDIRFSVIGVTTDPSKRPVRQWTKCDIEGREFEFFPLEELRNPNRRRCIPTTLSFTWQVLIRRWAKQFDVIQSHRVEPFLPFLASCESKFLFLHQNMQVIASRNSDIRWRYAPRLYRMIERAVLRRMNQVFVVREDAVAAYRNALPHFQDKFRFLPTWMDPEVFHDPDEAGRRHLREKFQLGSGQNDEILLTFTGRLDRQKQPGVLLQAVGQLLNQGYPVRLALVGEGVLRQELESQAEDLGISDHVAFMGLRGREEVADLLKASDIFLLSSAYEGMPRCVLEALGCGVPVVATEVGEVQRVVRSGVNGELVPGSGVEAFSEGIERCIEHLPTYRGAPCTEAVRDYVPERVLAPLYEAYRRNRSERVAGSKARGNPGMLGYPLTLGGLEDDVREARTLLEDRGACSTIACFNPHSLSVARDDPEFATALHNADVLLPDGWGVVWGARWLGLPVATRVPGYELFQGLSKRANAEGGLRVFFLGSTPEVLDRIKERMAHDYPHIEVVGALSPPFAAEFTAEQSEEMIKAVNEASPDILWVGMTAPKQEKWLQQHRDRLAVPLAVAVGAVFDFYSGTKNRGPKWMREAGLEWLARLFQEPLRLWRRMGVSAPRFLWMIARARLAKGRAR